MMMMMMMLMMQGMSLNEFVVRCQSLQHWTASDVRRCPSSPATNPSPSSGTCFDLRMLTESAVLLTRLLFLSSMWFLSCHVEPLLSIQLRPMLPDSRRFPRLQRWADGSGGSYGSLLCCRTQDASPDCRDGQMEVVGGTGLSYAAASLFLQLCFKHALDSFIPNLFLHGSLVFLFLCDISVFVVALDSAVCVQASSISVFLTGRHGLTIRLFGVCMH